MAEKPAKATKPAAKTTANFEETLWDSANKLRGSVESSEYKHIVLSLIFLKFISDKFEARRQALIDDGKTPFIDMVEFYAQDNVFYLPEQARWDSRWREQQNGHSVRALRFLLWLAKN
jgi:type I restriction enzyme M protein